MKLVTLILVLLETSLFASSFPPQRDATTLAGITNIYIAQSRPDPLRESLTRALTKAGFRVVTDRSQADATLTVLFPQADIVDGSIPKKWIFIYELGLANNTIMWKYRVEFVRHANLDDDFDYGALKMAAKLLKDKEASIRKTRHK